MHANSPGEPKRWRFSRRDVVVLAAVVCFLLVLAIPAVRLARDSARRAQCANNLLQIGLGLQNYLDVYKCFPPAFIADEKGRPMHGWRVMTLPFWTCDPFYDMYDSHEPWNSPGNLKLAAEHGQCQYYYHCPADPSLEGMTDYLAVVGAATAWPGSVPSHVQDFSKGTSHSIQLVEQTRSGVHWIEPRDLPFDGLNFTIHSPSRMGFSRPRPGLGQAISSEHPNGAHALFADASVEFLAAGTSPEVLKDMLVIGGGKPKIPLGPRKRLRLVYDSESTDNQPRKYPYKLEPYTLDETRQPSR
ncbi:MAG TPA: DUF1559 domain-containing protein [Thermoguttaceae bacterium]|nr:DUF1559 domain-containing protein [Thermoguttaceae bacterium]